MGKKNNIDETLRRFNTLSNYNVNKLNEHIDEHHPVLKEDKGVKFIGTESFEKAKKRINMLMEFTVTNPVSMFEADDDNSDDAGGAPDGGMGGDPMGGGAPDGGMGGDPMGGGAPDGGMGGDPMGGGAPDGGMGGDPNAMGGGNTQGPEGFNPQMGGDPNSPDGGMGGDPNGMGMDQMGGDPNAMGGGDTMQPDDEVVDITELIDAQENIEKDVEKCDDKFSKVFKAIGEFEEILRQQNKNIEDLKGEFEKRNPTQIEKLSMQTDKSYPFNVTPDDFWRKKEATSNYSTDYDNNGKEQGQYTITAKDINGETDWKGIHDSLDDDDLSYNQTLKGLLGM